MRIGIDARWMIEEPSGIGQYTFQLIKHLMLHDAHNEYLLFFSSPKIKDRVFEDLSIGSCPNFQGVLFPYSVFSLRSQFLLPWYFFRLKIDLFHSTNFMIPLFSLGTRRVITLHDLIPFLFPEFAPRSKKSRFYLLYRFLLKIILRRVDHILLDSEHSFEDLVRHFPKVSSKSRVLTFGIDASFRPRNLSQKRKDVRERFGIKGRILLYVGRQDPYKNLISLVKIFHRLLENVPDVTLVLAGPEDRRYPELKNLIQERHLQEKVWITGFLSQEELVAFYQEASVFVLPSLYEGFGLPILEAFACGVPVVASHVASIPEVVGQAGILLNPKEEEAWVKAIGSLLKDEALRKTLIQKGFEQLKSFSWDRAVGRVLRCYEDVCRK